ncbi:MAG TPA: hypothetical protein PKA59_11690 [Chakrabartia sp.]|jgi:hypothetical protein|nr:hypothetical protein [Chakrabartia sp.]
MTNFADMMTRYIAERDIHIARARQMLFDNKAILLPLLDSLGVATVELEFDGAADSGQFDSPSLWGLDGTQMACPNVEVEVGSLPDRGEVMQRTLPLEQALDHFAYDALETNHPGWEINEGASGTLRIDVAARTISLECSLRTSHYDESEIGGEA